jgi:hypothetical protein
LASLFIVAAVQTMHLPRFNPKAATISGRITATPQWGAGAFESFDQLMLEPQRD